MTKLPKYFFNSELKNRDLVFYLAIISFIIYFFISCIPFQYDSFYFNEQKNKEMLSADYALAKAVAKQIKIDSYYVNGVYEKNGFPRFVADKLVILRDRNLADNLDKIYTTDTNISNGEGTATVTVKTTVTTVLSHEDMIHRLMTMLEESNISDEVKRSVCTRIINGYFMSYSKKKYITSLISEL